MQRYHFVENERGVFVLNQQELMPFLAPHEYDGKEPLSIIGESLYEQYQLDDNPSLQVEFFYQHLNDTHETKYVLGVSGDGPYIDQVEEFPSESFVKFDVSEAQGFNLETGSDHNDVDFTKPADYYYKKAAKSASKGKLTRRQMIIGGSALGAAALLGGGYALSRTIGGSGGTAQASNKIQSDAPVDSAGNTKGDVIYTQASEAIRSGESTSFSAEYPDTEWTYQLQGSEPQISYTTNAFAYKSGYDVILVDYRTGDNIITKPINEKVQFIVDTIIDGKNAVAWRDGLVLNYWTREDGVKSINTPSGSSVVNPGSSILVVNSDGTTESSYIIKDGALVKVKIPDNMLSLAADPEGVISAHSSGIIALSDTVGTANVQLSHPDDLKLVKFMTAGYGITVTAWSKKDTPSVNDEVVIAVHRISTGELLSQFTDTLAVTQNSDAAGKAVKVAPGGLLAVIANRVVISVTSGKILLDARTIDGTLVEARGQFISGKDSKGSFLHRFDTNSTHRDSVPMLNNPSPNMVLTNSSGNTVTLLTNRSANNQA